MLKKTLGIILIIAVIAGGFYQKEAWLDAIKAGGLISVLCSMLLIAADVFFPIVPFAIIAALNGAVFGIANGVWITLAGSMLGTILLFFLARYSFRDWARKKIKAYPAIQGYEASFDKNAFTAVLLGRLIPVIPSLVMNVVCGLSSVRWHVFFFASLIGKIPNILVVTIAGANFSSNKLLSFSIYGAYVLILMLIIYIKFPHLVKASKK
ncbi:TVP38/TMEM64 family protein [Bacillus halotolerans]|uniref:TVP38/TMEM64 family protein n=1 Tax=Bacillus halotolerans TaxID=260554 RepID=UPI000D0127B4|nr:TVP38/TMEM64 family protein [Bacillus halotolerans]PRP52799.1 TVP38/TMEM64 family protein [Bacillus halotolerans]PRP56877.1 TVP38/TMEM64 family protein [Bacillus halotolerans]PRP60302.1 TVP38/TMEM64 family protein [Bacillus halotolerans]PRP64967.1 TVP38/TMEM64 family protein [Bacillus halotolerans]